VSLEPFREHILFVHRSHSLVVAGHNEIWNEAARHYDEPALAALVLWIATVNVFNRVNVATRQVPGLRTPGSA
jgi:alkylhydroperoxidase family enzyme